MFKKKKNPQRWQRETLLEVSVGKPSVLTEITKDMMGESNVNLLLLSLNSHHLCFSGIESKWVSVVVLTLIRRW